MGPGLPAAEHAGLRHGRKRDICLTLFPAAPLPRPQGLQPSLWEGASEMQASVCPVPGSRRQMDIVTTRAGAGGPGVRAAVVGGCPFCLLLAPPQSPRSQGLQRAQTTTPQPPLLHPASPSVAGNPSPVPQRGSCPSPSGALFLPLTGSSAGCLPSGHHHHQLSRNQKPHKQKTTKPRAEISDIGNKAREKINENKNPIL